jgi:Xaa-Pro aminopeptidase
MHVDRVAKLRAEMARAGIDTLLLLGTSNVSYATGAMAPGTDSSRALIARPVALLTEEGLDLYTPYPDGVPADLPAGRVHDAVFPEFDEGAAGLASEVSARLPAGARLACDELTHSLRPHLAEWEVCSASAVLGAAKICKTADELACIRQAQTLNQMAMLDVIRLVRPGVRQSDLSARFLRRVHELGATSNGIDPIWQPMPTTLTAGPWTTHGGVAFPTASSDRFLREGDVVWVDSGIVWQGYASDFGRTWIVSDDPRPTGRQEAQFERWTEVVEAVLERVKPGATGLELVRAAIDANGGNRPWIEHFYLAHGVGTDSAEMPLIGTDLGDAFDEQLQLAPGMVLVLEPVIWDDGAAGYRSEDIYAVTDDGWAALSDFAFDPYGHPAGNPRAGASRVGGRR